MTFLLVTLAGVICGGLIYRTFFRQVVVQEGHAGLLYVDGRLVRTLPPGRHRLPRRSSVTCLDLRERLLTVAGQELASRDQVNVKISLAVSFAVELP
jgi:regulator of protease activity HflC (stomatin/prohibitin superfamily)